MIRASFDARRLVWVLGTVIASGLAFAAVTPAQQTEQAKKSPAAAESNQGQRKTARRLPAYYSRVVNQKQREQIYEVQAKYQSEIDALEEQLQALIAKRDAEIEAVLTPEQRESLTKLKAEAAAQRASAKRESAQEAAPAQEAPPAATPAPPARTSAKKPARSTAN
jgi:Spy/CpxP family protein refolding chaperone